MKIPCLFSHGKKVYVRDEAHELEEGLEPSVSTFVV